jgi:hypothetical protein
MTQGQVFDIGIAIQVSQREENRNTFQAIQRIKEGSDNRWY